MGPGLVSYTGSNQHLTYIYCTDGGRQCLVQTLLRGGLVSQRLEGDAVATTGVARACWTSMQGIRLTFFPVCAYGGVLPLLAVRNYMCRKKLPRQAGRRLALSPGAFGQRSLAIVPIGWGTTSHCRGVVHGGDEGGKSGGGFCPCLFTARPTLHRSLSLSVSLSPSLSLSPDICVPSLEACLTSCLAASAGKLTSHG
jgi:hypothetical protein